MPERPTWFLAIYLISQAKTGLSSLALKRQLGVSYPTAWLMHHKIMDAVAQCDSTHRLHGSAQLDDAYLGGERSGGKVGRGSDNKVPFVAASSLGDMRRLNPRRRWRTGANSSSRVPCCLGPSVRSRSSSPTEAASTASSTAGA